MKSKEQIEEQVKKELSIDSRYQPEFDEMVKNLLDSIDPTGLIIIPEEHLIQDIRKIREFQMKWQKEVDNSE